VKSLEGEQQPGEGAKGVEAPFVRGCGVCGAEVRDDPIESVSTTVYTDK
jgi:Pyruvate/2-oxoacid:ferredoxin oxidoreductase delta subunit